MMSLPFDFRDTLPDPGLQPDELVMLAEDGEPIHADELARVQEIPRDAIRRILDLVLPSSRNADGTPFWETAVCRLAALAWSVHPDVRKYAQSEIADAIGRTRASLNVSIVELRDLGNLDHRGGCCDKARQTFAESQRQSWKRRKSLQPTADSIG